MRILLLSGPLAVGKTSIAEQLEKIHSFNRIRTGKFLSELAQKEGLVGDRTALQELGDRLDVQTDFGWLIDQVAGPTIKSNSAVRFWLLDSVRKMRQVAHFRRRYGKAVSHVHLVAPEVVLQARYESRLTQGGEYIGGVPYSVAIRHPNEIASRSLVEIADKVIDVEASSISEIAGDIVKVISEDS